MTTITTGMSRQDGALLKEADHIRQSVRDILTTPLGSRLLRRNYGSLLPFLIDQPTNQATKLKLMAATATALILWEPRVSVRGAQIHVDSSTYQWTLQLELRTTVDNEKLATSLTFARGAA